MFYRDTTAKRYSFSSSSDLCKSWTPVGLENYAKEYSGHLASQDNSLLLNIQNPSLQVPTKHRENALKCAILCEN